MTGEGKEAAIGISKFDSWVGKIPGEGNGNPLEYSCLENPMDGGAWWATVQGVAKSRKRLSNLTFTFTAMESQRGAKLLYTCSVQISF